MAKTSSFLRGRLAQLCLELLAHFTKTEEHCPSGAHTTHNAFSDDWPRGSDRRACLILRLPAPKAHGLAWPGLHASGPQGSHRPPSKDPPWPPLPFSPSPLPPPLVLVLPARAAARAALMGQVAPQLGVSKGSLCIET